MLDTNTLSDISIANIFSQPETHVCFINGVFWWAEDLNFDKVQVYLFFYFMDSDYQLINHYLTQANEDMFLCLSDKTFCFYNLIYDAFQVSFVYHIINESGFIFAFI